MKLITNAIFFLLIIGCSEKKNQDLINAEKTASEFYTWYLTDIYGKVFPGYESAHFKKVNDSIYTLDVEGHVARLKELGFFSESYLKQERELMQECANVLLTQEFVEIVNGKKYYGINNEIDLPGCDFMHSDRWVGGQGETIDSFKITNSEKVGEEVIVTVNFKHWIEAKLTMRKKDNYKKINHIELIFGD